jgi:hypothetical protein
MMALTIGCALLMLVVVQLCMMAITIGCALLMLVVVLFVVLLLPLLLQGGTAACFAGYVLVL